MVEHRTLTPGIGVRLPERLPGPLVTFTFTLEQARDVFEAYKASRYDRPRMAEIRGIMARAIASATAL